MEASDKKRTICQVVTLLAVAHQVEVTTVLLEAYYLALKDLPDDQISQRGEWLLKTSAYFPKPAEFRDSSSAEDDAPEAYRILNDAIARHGYMRHVDFEDKAINAAVRSLGGWQAACDVTDEQEPFYRARFIKAYLSYRRAGVGDEAGKCLSGASEADRVKRLPDGTIIEQAVTKREVKCTTTQSASRQNLIEAKGANA